MFSAMQLSIQSNWGNLIASGLYHYTMDQNLCRYLQIWYNKQIQKVRNSFFQNQNFQQPIKLPQDPAVLPKDFS